MRWVRQRRVAASLVLCSLAAGLVMLLGPLTSVGGADAGPARHGEGNGGAGQRDEPEVAPTLDECPSEEWSSGTLDLIPPQTERQARGWPQTALQAAEQVVASPGFSSGYGPGLELAPGHGAAEPGSAGRAMVFAVQDDADAVRALVTVESLGHGAFGVTQLSGCSPLRR